MAKNNTEVTVAKLPPCDIHVYEKGVAPKDAPLAAYDGKTTRGPWANMCPACFKAVGVGLGLGKGQKLVLAEQP